MLTLKIPNMRTIRAKFECYQVVPPDEKYCYPATARLQAVIAEKDGRENEENKSFSDATPSGSLEIMISQNVPASNFFKEGREYYLDFTRIPLESTKE